jgi:hypothetical protein
MKVIRIKSGTRNMSDQRMYPKKDGISMPFSSVPDLYSVTFCHTDHVFNPPIP